MAVAVESLKWNGVYDLPIPSQLEEMYFSNGASLPQLKIETVDNVFDAFLKAGEEALMDDVHETEPSIIKLEKEIFSLEDQGDQIKFKDEGKVPNFDNISVGVTNYNILYILKDEDYNHQLNKFKENIHCSQEIVVLYLNKEFHRQRHSCLTAAEVNAEFIEELLQHTTLIILQKKEVNPGIVKFFKEKDVSTKRCLVKCSGVVHGLALAKKWRALSNSPTKKANNVFSNYQRADRVASKRLVESFVADNKLPKCPSYQEIEEKALVSFEVYNREGFLCYASEKSSLEHTVFYDNGEAIYFIKHKYLNAFGKTVTPKKKSDKKIKVKRLK